MYGARRVRTWRYRIGHGNATRTISNYTPADGKEAQEKRGEAAVLSKRPLAGGDPVENSSSSFPGGYSAAPEIPENGIFIRHNAS